MNKFSNLKFKLSSGQIVSGQDEDASFLNTIVSLFIIIFFLGLTYYPLLFKTTLITIVTGSELQEPFKEIKTKFEAENPRTDLEFKIQGSQDIITNFVDDKNDFNTTVLIPANEQLINQLQIKLNSSQSSDIFYNQPQVIAKTLLVAIAWQERGDILFPNNQFSWQNLNNALENKQWQQLGGQKKWGSFDFLMTDPLRSNSSQLALNLWAQSTFKSSKSLNQKQLNSPSINQLFKSIKSNVYQPPRSTDILLQEFIVRGANDVDIAITYESIALYRWQQIKQSNKKDTYLIYYPNPSVETQITAVIPRKNVSKNEAKQAQKFIDFLLEDEQQIILSQYGFRPANNKVDLSSLSDSIWQQKQSGIQIDPQIKINPSPEPEILEQIQTIWQQN